MKRKERFKSLQEATETRRDAVARFAKRKSVKVHSQPAAGPQSRDATPEKAAPTVPLAAESRTELSLLSLFREGDLHPSVPTSAVLQLSDLYLHAARYRTRHIGLVWPATLKALALVHALATFTRWTDGDKQGVRGLLYPVKSNVFYPLNHIHVDRKAVLRIASELVEIQPNFRVKRSLQEKDAFLYSLSENSLPTVDDEPFNPTIGELLPHFLATPDSVEWKSCSNQLLAQIRAKLVKRAQAKALAQLNCAVIGDPDTAPDAIFALDGRLSAVDLRQALRKLADLRPPEVVLISASRAVRLEASGWAAAIARFCMTLEQVFSPAAPGVVIVTDEPRAAYRLKNELWKRNEKRDPSQRWRTRYEFRISGLPHTAGSGELLPVGVAENLHPTPREFDVYIVDADIAKVANKLIRIANAVPGGRQAAKPLVDAANYLTRIAALPCGIRHLSEYLARAEVQVGTRVAFDWPSRIGAIHDFDRTIGVGEERSTLMTCVDEGSRLIENYQDATPFAHKLAELVASVAAHPRRHIVVVFPSSLSRRLAEQFLSEYTQFPDNISFDTLQDRVHFISTSRIESYLTSHDTVTLVFAGLNDDCLRLLLTDERVSAHSKIVLTQRAGQALRASLKPIVKRFPEFKSFKPRIGSILRQLKDLPDDSSVLSSGYTLPTFRIELSSTIAPSEHSIDPDSWLIRLDNGTTQYRSDGSVVYVYDPASQQSSDRGFRTCQVKSLEVGDKIFIMSAELRELLEETLREAGLPIHSDKTFEAALRSYHDQVQTRFAQRFPVGTLSEKVRALRKEILRLEPGLHDELPQEQAMRHWIDLGNSPNTPFEQLRPQAPMHEATFKAFAEVLGFSPLEAAYQWQRVIMAVRNSRRLDGRHLSDIYAYMLLQPESVMANSSIKRDTLTFLFEEARANLAGVEWVGPSKEQG